MSMDITSLDYMFVYFIYLFLMCLFVAWQLMELQVVLQCGKLMLEMKISWYKGL